MFYRKDSLFEWLKKEEKGNKEGKMYYNHSFIVFSRHLWGALVFKVKCRVFKNTCLDDCQPEFDSWPSLTKFPRVSSDSKFIIYSLYEFCFHACFYAFWLFSWRRRYVIERYSDSEALPEHWEKRERKITLDYSKHAKIGFI